MSRVDRLNHAFVETVPDHLDEGTLYIALGHATMLHLCACGCGSEVVLPLSPTDWRMMFDGETVSVSPSVGSWSLACRSHYVVDHGRVRWAGNWTNEEIAAGRRRDRRCKDTRAGAVDKITTPHNRSSATAPASPVIDAIARPYGRMHAGWSTRLKRWLRL